MDTTLDLSKLTPGPLVVKHSDAMAAVARQDDPNRFVILWQMNVDDVAFYALARNAFDIQMRRGWGVKCRHGATFIAVDADGMEVMGPTHAPYVLWGYFDNPFTAIIAADAWMKEHEVNHGS